MINYSGVVVISIVVLSYNHEKYISETLASVYGLNILKEVIIIDDCSKDSSAKIIRDTVAKYEASDHTRVIIKEKNAGLIDSLNTGLKIAHSDYIYFIASDDVVDADGFTFLYNELCSNNDAQFMMGNAWIYHTGDTPTEVVYKKQHKDFFAYNDNILREKIFTNFPKPLLLQATIFKRSALKNIGGWDAKIAWDDYPMFVKLFQKFSLTNGDYFFNNNINVVKYRQHDSNAYKNLTKQLSMIEVAMKELAPSELYDKAISRQYAFYLLLAVKSRDLKSARYVLNSVIRERVLLMTIFNLGAEIIQWYHRKKK